MFIHLELHRVFRDWFGAIGSTYIRKNDRLYRVQASRTNQGKRKRGYLMDFIYTLTGEFRSPKKGEWFYGLTVSEPVQACFDFTTCFPILTLHIE
jgi:hypothetical protein